MGNIVERAYWQADTSPPSPVEPSSHVASRSSHFNRPPSRSRHTIPPSVLFWVQLAGNRHLNKVSESYWDGLFHCYEVAGLVRTNNDLESHFRDLQHRLLRTTGQKGGTRRALHRLGAWELLKPPSSEPECLETLREISAEELADERQRVDQHRQRFRFEVRSVKHADDQLDRLLRQWLAIPKQSTG